MKALQILIVEDEILIAETLRLYLRERGHEVVDIVISYEEALEAYHLRKPDLILLDIRLYGSRSGIDFAAYISTQKITTPYIFLTSQYDQRILTQALETNPYGYLTKPIRKESLWTTVESAYHLHQSVNTSDPYISIQEGKNNYNIPVKDIVYVQADHVYCKIVMADKKEIIIRKTLKEIMGILNYTYMLNCHRSYIINTGYITHWNQDSIKLNSEIMVPISRSRRHEILEKLSKKTDL